MVLKKYDTFYLFLAALRSRYFAAVVSVFLLLSFPRLISAVGDCLHRPTILPHIMWP